MELTRRNFVAGLGIAAVPGLVDARPQSWQRGASNGVARARRPTALGQSGGCIGGRRQASLAARLPGRGATVIVLTDTRSGGNTILSAGMMLLGD
ncbi:MAG: hypothetical protein ACLTQI_05855 [Slackia sp.]